MSHGDSFDHYAHYPPPRIREPNIDPDAVADPAAG